MRTTVELSPELLRAAKADAATRGETLKEFLTRAVTHELGRAAPSSVPGSSARARVSLPLVRSARPGSVDITNADIEAIVAGEEAERDGGR